MKMDVEETAEVYYTEIITEEKKIREKTYNVEI